MKSGEQSELVLVAVDARCKVSDLSTLSLPPTVENLGTYRFLECVASAGVLE